MTYALPYARLKAKRVEHRAWRYLWPVTVFLLASVSYLPALNAGFIWDDPDFVTENVCLRSVHGLWQIWFEPANPVAPRQYYPLVFTTLWAEYQFVGTEPFLYHFNNVLLHAVGCTLFWFALRQLRVP